MVKLKTVSPGSRWHKTPDGKVTRCTATVKPCPYAHFETFEEAKNPRERQARKAEISDLLEFSTPIGTAEASPLNGERARPSLRQAAENARRIYMTTGHRPASPLGDFQVALPGQRRIVILRESFDLRDGEEAIGTRYVVKYYPDPHHYDQSMVDLNTRLDRAMLQKTLQGYFAKVGDSTADPLARAQVLELFDQTTQRITEVEVMVHGSEKAMKKLGLDIFDKDVPETHTLKTSYSASTLQPYDITEALRVHATTDPYVHGVALQITEPFPKNPEAKWTLDRLPEGGWYVGVKIPPKDFVSTPVSEPGEISFILGKAMREQGVFEQDVVDQTSFCEQLMSEIEPAVKSYEATVRARVGDDEEFSDDYFFELEEAEKESPYGTSDKLWDLYS